MAASFANRTLTAPDKALVTPRPTQAKASLPDNPGQEALSSVVMEAARKAYGKQGAAAAQLGKDEGNFSRDTKAERLTLRDLRALGPEFLAALGEQLVGQYGALSTPQERARQTVRELRRLTDELDQCLEHIA